MGIVIVLLLKLVTWTLLELPTKLRILWCGYKEVMCSSTLLPTSPCVSHLLFHLFFFISPLSAMVLQIIQMFNHKIMVDIRINGRITLTQYLFNLQIDYLKLNFCLHELFTRCHLACHGSWIERWNSNCFEPFACIRWIQCFFES